MNDSYEYSNYEEDFSIQDVLDDFDKYCASMRRELEETFHDLNADLRRANIQLKKKNEAVQAKSIMSIMVPILSDLRNEVLDTDNVEIIRESFSSQYRYLKERLSAIGVELSYHERGERIAYDDKVQGSGILTGDCTKDQTCCRCVSMGWTIKGEERTPVTEEIQIYRYDRSLDSTPPRDRYADYEDSRDKSRGNNGRKKRAEDQNLKNADSDEYQPLEEKRTISIPTEWTEANVAYDIYIEHTCHSECRYVARPGEFYRIYNVIEFDRSLKGSVIYYGPDPHEINKDVDRIWTQCVKNKKTKRIEIEFYLDGDSNPIFRAECQEIKKF